MTTTMTPAVEPRYLLTMQLAEAEQLVLDFEAYRVTVDAGEIAVFTNVPLRDELLERWQMHRAGTAAISDSDAPVRASVYGPREGEQSV